MDSIKQGVNYVSETVQQATSGASKETNKQVAKDGNAPIGTRASAAKDALGDKANEHKHDAKAEAHKQQI
ncbi:glucose repressible protein Grg1 [Metarhizium rileyi]|uniref:Glucose repressible protein Grg1 n=1 Tax=Metarhizium rileyi (strain RCEF 4871) TaxID=1649241 RepID=A0A167FMH0_METRR|nr:glucose repressible protein Grg1 [Metarhizium rileyi RCEF 4871]TWU78355.1 Glucose-repressible protein [Metarhizium rileyi]